MEKNISLNPLRLCITFLSKHTKRTVRRDRWETCRCSWGNKCGIDLRDGIRSLRATNGDFEAKKEEAFTQKGSKIRLKLSQFDQVLKECEWLTGNLTIANFYLFERIDMIHEMESKRLDPYPNLISFRERSLQIPKVKAHRNSENFIKLWQIPGTTAWNNGDKMWEDRDESLVINNVMNIIISYWTIVTLYN